MPRPRRFRKLGFTPEATYFKPAGVGMQELDEVTIATDELEAVRLKDLQGMSQEEAAGKMGISQPTFHRVVREARRKIADALINGKAIRIQGVSWAGCKKKRFKRF